tara:strand:- start:259 stop:1575 length:1317 start_codon:yes stop_codon:yes gene_type:complete
LKETGPYIAEVVRVFELYDLGSSDIRVPLDYWEHFQGQTEGKIVVLRVRIPEIDTFGVPTTLAADDTAFAALMPEDRHRIERYPKCIAKYLNMEVPSPGQAVWVDFRDPKNRSGRMYLGLVSSEQTTSVSGEDSAKDLFEKGQPSAKDRCAEDPKCGIDTIEEYKLYDKIKTQDSTLQIRRPNTPYMEQRVRAGAFASLRHNDPLIVGYRGGAKVHKLFAKRLEAMNEAWTAETGNPPFTSNNGLREPPEVRYSWLKKPSSSRFKTFANSKSNGPLRRKHNAANLKAALAKGETNLKKLWFAMLKDEYDGDLKLGKERRGWNSPHQTGLVVDFNNNGLTPSTKTSSPEEQRKTVAHKWLKKNAYKYGINPYYKEPWHWECVVPRENFGSGKEFTGLGLAETDTAVDDAYPFNMRIEERSTKGRKLATTHHIYAANKFT